MARGKNKCDNEAVFKGSVEVLPGQANNNESAVQVKKHAFGAVQGTDSAAVDSDTGTASGTASDADSDTSDKAALATVCVRHARAAVLLVIIFKGDFFLGGRGALGVELSGVDVVVVVAVLVPTADAGADRCRR